MTEPPYHCPGGDDLCFVTDNPKFGRLAETVREYHKKWNLLTTPRKLPRRPSKMVDDFIAKCNDDAIFAGEFATVSHTEIISQLILTEEELDGDGIDDGAQTYEMVNDRILIGGQSAWPMNSRFSVLIKPKVHLSFLEEMNKMLPKSIFPNLHDTKESVLKKNDKCQWLDEVWRHGHVRPTNGDSTSKQPCRRTVSLARDYPRKINNPSKNEIGRFSTTLLVYTCREMPVNKWQVRPATNREYAKVLEIWRLAWPFLRGPSRSLPPNAWQYVIYQGILGRKMGDHRDNFSRESLRRMANGQCPFSDKDSWSGYKNSQTYGSSVIIYSFGNCPMKMVFSCLSPDADGGAYQHKTMYKVCPSYSFQVGEGYICILDSIDDILMMHGLTFEGIQLKGNPTLVRAALVIRWLENWQEFFTDTSTIRDKKLCYNVDKPAAKASQWTTKSAWT